MFILTKTKLNNFYCKNIKHGKYKTNFKNKRIEYFLYFYTLNAIQSLNL